jgi:PAS domain S-box-containing protein
VDPSLDLQSVPVGVSRGAHEAQLRVWAVNGPGNLEHRALLVAAEIARAEGRELDAERLYEQAIISARANRSAQNEAPAYELAARSCAARGLRQVAGLYLRDARTGYLRWSALGKVRQLDETHRSNEETMLDLTSTIGAPVEHLCLATVIKVLQAVSSEIVLENLIDTLMRTAITQAGAERALLIMLSGQAPRIEAEATAGHDAVTVRLVDEAATEHVLPESVLHYVLRTRETIVLEDAATRAPFDVDAYIRQRGTQSILGLPLLNRSRLIGVLYLENSRTSRAFAPTRISVLKLLASQAAIALDNARLYRDVAEREKKIRRLVNSNVVGVVIRDREGRIVEANDEFLRTVDHERDDLVAGRIRWAEFTPRDWRDSDDVTIEEQSDAGRFEPFEITYVRKDGRSVPLLIGGATFEEGGNEGVAFVLDLSERKRAEEALKESEAKFRDYAETASDWLWEIGPDYKYTLLTENAFHSDPADRIGKFCWDYALDLEAEPEKWLLVRAALQSRKPFRDFLYCSVDGSGSPIFVKTSGKPVFDGNGEFRGYRGTGTDVTAIIRAQKAEASLRTAQAELAHAGRVVTLGQLTASIAHEVSQPIGSARNNARAALNFLNRPAPNLDEVREALTCIVDDADRAGGIVDRIKDQIKKASPRSDHFDLNRAIEEVIMLAQGRITENGISVQSSFASEMAPVHGDRIQVQQVVLNLILNAIEAMSPVEAADRVLSISTEKTRANGALVVVRDSGPGIDPKRLDRVFEAFYTTKSGGMGMGLSICRSIIDAHGGRLWAVANEPKGAQFQFTLPSAETRLSIDRTFARLEDHMKTSS